MGYQFKINDVIDIPHDTGKARGQIIGLHHHHNHYDEHNTHAWIQLYGGGYTTRCVCDIECVPDFKPGDYITSRFVSIDNCKRICLSMNPFVYASENTQKGWRIFTEDMPGAYRIHELCKVRVAK